MSARKVSQTDRMVAKLARQAARALLADARSLERGDGCQALTMVLVGHVAPSRSIARGLFASAIACAPQVRDGLGDLADDMVTAMVEHDLANGGPPADDEATPDASLN